MNETLINIYNIPFTYVSINTQVSEIILMPWKDIRGLPYSSLPPWHPPSTIKGMHVHSKAWRWGCKPNFGGSRAQFEVYLFYSLDV